MTYQTEFPGFAAADIPACVLQPGWTDASWHNDVCPVFIHGATGLAVWVDAADASARNDGDGGPRYAVTQMIQRDGDQGWYHGEEPPIWSGDEGLECEVMALLFAATLKEWIGDQWTEMTQRDDGGPCCPSHDYCDANMAMESAFFATHGREFAMADADLWNAAWSRAREAWRQ